jgi:hypothetical protein
VPGEHNQVMVRKTSKQGVADGDPAETRWARWRPLISLLLLAHLTVVCVTPLAFVPPNSALAIRVTQWAAPYLEAGNISHGYAFFAPDPGLSSAIVHYEIDHADGTFEEGDLPDVERHWPRLLYHRHFMLSEQLAGMAAPERGPPPPPESVDPRIMKDWQRDYKRWQVFRDRYLARARSYAEHLLKKHQAKEVRLRLIRHRVPSPLEVRGGLRLDDRRLYEEDEPKPIAIVTAEEPT